jgi:hypothetical protein
MHISGAKLCSSLHRTTEYAFVPVLAFHPELHYFVKIPGLQGIVNCKLLIENWSLATHVF